MAALGLVLAVSTATYLMASAGVGRFVDRFDTTALLWIACGLAAVGTSFFVQAFSWPSVLAGAALLGLGCGAINSLTNAHAVVRGRLRRVILLHASWGVGATTGPAVVSLTLAVAGSARLAFIPMALVFLLAAVGVWRCRGDWSLRGEVPAPIAPVATERPVHSNVTFRAALGGAMMFVYVGLEWSAGQWSYTELANNATRPDLIAGCGVILYWFALTAGRVVLGFAPRSNSIGVLLDMSILSTLIGALAFWLLPGDVAALTALPILGFGLSGIAPLLLKWTTSGDDPRWATRAIGYQLAAGSLGGAICPAMVGLSMQWSGVQTMPPLLFGLALVMAALHGLTRLSDSALQLRRPSVSLDRPRATLSATRRAPPPRHTA